MRLGWVIYGNLGIITGGFIYDRLVVDYLRRQGDDVDVISVPWHPYALGLAHNLWPALARRLQQGRFDAIIQDELSHPSFVWLNCWLKPRLGCPIISLVHLLRSTEARPAWQNRLYQALERRYLHSVDGFIFISRHTQTAVEALIGPGKPYTIAYSAGDRLGGLSAGEIAARAAAPGPRQILFLGAVIPRKGLDVLLRALAPLRDLDWQLTIAGSFATAPRYARTIYKLICRLGLSHKLHLPGVIQGEELRACFRRSHILAVPSFIEGLALVYLEGMYHGLVPVASALGGAVEVITPGQEGFLISPGDVPSLTAGLRDLLTDPTRLRTMGLAARERIGRHSTWDQTGAAIRDFLHRVAGSGSG